MIYVLLVTHNQIKKTTTTTAKKNKKKTFLTFGIGNKTTADKEGYSHDSNGLPHK